MTTAIIGTGRIGSAIVRQLAPGGEDPPAIERRQGVGAKAADALGDTSPLRALCYPRSSRISSD